MSASVGGSRYLDDGGSRGRPAKEGTLRRGSVGREKLLEGCYLFAENQNHAIVALASSVASASVASKSGPYTNQP